MTTDLTIEIFLSIFLYTFQFCLHYTSTNFQHLFLDFELTPILQQLKSLDTIGYCQRQVFSLYVSQHKHKITSL